MAYVAAHPEFYTGKIIGAGDPVSLVETLAGTPSTATWRRGVQVVHASSIPKGTVIATMADHHYPSVGGNAAICMSQDSFGIRILEQPVGERARFRTVTRQHEGGSNDANAYYVVE